MEFIFTLDELKTAAKKFLSLAGDHKIFAFHGELAAGKTTFISAVCRELGITKNTSSPTFSIINEYDNAEKEIIYHIDLYRIKNEKEAIQAGVEDCIYSGNICFIEWPEKAFSILPINIVQVFIERVTETQRKIIIKLP